MTDEQDVARGHRAEEVLGNEEYQRAFSDLEQWIYTEWCKPQSEESLRELRSLLKSSRLYRSMLESVMRTGQLAADNLHKRRPLAERLGVKPRTL